MSDFERIAFEASLRALDKQESLLDELRARTGVLLAAATVAASFLGNAALSGSPSPVLALAAGTAFLVAALASVLVLLPKNDLVFSLAGTQLYEGFHEHRHNLPEAYRRLAYDLDDFWVTNDERIAKLTRAYRLAAGALVIEILLLAALISGNLL